MRLFRVALIPFLLGCSCVLAAQTLESRPAAAPVAVPQKPNSHPLYLQLRSASTSGEVRHVTDLTIRRDAGVFTFKSGDFFFMTAVNGKVTGAVFVGQGSFSLTPPTAVEKRALKLFTNDSTFNEEFSAVVFRFTDASYDELKKQGTPPSAPVASPAASLLAEVRRAMTYDLQYNFEARVLEDVMSDEPGGLFAAFIQGKKYGNKLLYIVDPQGVPDISPRDVRVPFYRWISLSGMAVAPEEIALINYDSQKYAIWTAFHYSSEYAQGTANGAEQNSNIAPECYKIDAAIDKTGRITARSTLTFLARQNSVRVVMLDLFETLRVKKVTAADGQALDFLQEDVFNKDDAKANLQVAVILPKALAKGERHSFTVEYEGSNAIENMSGGNYYPYTRDTWYPTAGFGRYATYEITFAIPKGLSMVATGTLVKQFDEGNQNISQWTTGGVPIAVAGFNFGRFKKEEEKTDRGFAIEAFANTDDPGIAASIQAYKEQRERAGYKVYGASVGGTMNTTGMLKKVLGEGQLAVPLYTDFFGPTPYQRVAITQQTALGFGQSWPELVYLPLTAFLDAAARHSLGYDDSYGFFKEVGPHELAHQWWGHAVGFSSYRDQWISEGFAEFSASLFIQAFYTEGNEFHKFWNNQRDLMFKKSAQGYRGVDAGPITLGYRLMTGKTGVDIPRRLIYPKGAYILHMIRMMLWENQNGDAQFKNLMRDFVHTYTNRPASTEDFKAVVERHMTPAMNIAGNGKMDWFFNEWVYGTAVPTMNFAHSFSRAPDGTVMLNLKLVQSGVDDSFMMPVPLYIEVGNGRIFRIGMIPMKGNSTFEKSIALRGIQEPPKRAMINYFDDVLTAN